MQSLSSLHGLVHIHPVILPRLFCMVHFPKIGTVVVSSALGRSSTGTGLLDAHFSVLDAVVVSSAIASAVKELFTNGLLHLL